ncbi:MAG: hypothetical protein U1E70_20395 [Acetobacteraceae bacterium]
MTAQARDWLRYEGDVWVMNADPLSYWWVVHDDIGDAIARAGMRNTANYRGYICFWTIVEGCLFLTEFDSHAVPSPAAVQSRMPIFAGWVCGEFALLRRKPLEPLSEPGANAGHNTFIRLGIESGRVEVRQRVSVMVRDLGGSFALGRTPVGHRAPNAREHRADAAFHWNFDLNAGLRAWPDMHDSLEDKWGLRDALLAGGLKVDPLYPRALEAVGSRKH